MADVFICYHEKSAGELVAKISDALENAGISCWYSGRDIPPGGDFAHCIPSQIDACKVFLLILNEGSNQSEHVKTDLHLAFRRINRHEEMTIIPFKVDNCVLSDVFGYYLSGLNILKGNSQYIQELIEKISYIVHKKPASKITQGPKVSVVKDVFISYHEKSTGKTSASKLVPKIASELENNNISCWYAEQNLSSVSGSYKNAIVEAIYNCKVFLLILNEDVKQSEDVKCEVEIAFLRYKENRQTKLIPFQVDDCSLSAQDGELYYNLVRLQIMNGNPPDTQHIQELVKRIQQTIGIVPSPSLQSPPAKIIKAGNCGENVTYALDEEGILTISGTGAMKNYDHDTKTDTLNTPWRNEHNKISHVNIEHGVSSIGKYAFFQCVNLTSISIADTVTKIEAEAFGRCRKLLNITIPDSVTRIDVGAFEDCRSLTSITIPDSVTKIDWWVFKGCNNLTSISVPRKVKVGFRAFPETADITYRAKRK